MIDIGVGRFQTPYFRIHPEIPFHVVVHFALQVDTEFPVRTDHDIGANAFAFRNIAVRIRDRKIRCIVIDFVFGQRERGIRQPVVEILLRNDRQQE